MAKIRNFMFYDTYKIKELTSFLSNKAHVYNSCNVVFPFDLLHKLLPLYLKWTQESYVAYDNNNILGAISLKPKRYNFCKWQINNLFLNQNSYIVGEQLINFILSKYAAKGVNSFYANICYYNDAILDLFIKNCGFRFSGSVQFWELSPNYQFNEDYNNIWFKIRKFKNKNAKYLANVHNESILPYFKFSLSASPIEFCDYNFFNIKSSLCLKFDVLSLKSKKIVGYFYLYSKDRKNFVLDSAFVQSFEFNLKYIINFSINFLKKNYMDFNLFIKNNKYQITSAFYEDFLTKNKFKLIHTEAILVKDFVKPIKSEIKLLKPSVFFNDINGNPAFKNTL